MTSFKPTAHSDWVRGLPRSYGSGGCRALLCASCMCQPCVYAAVSRVRSGGLSLTLLRIRTGEARRYTLAYDGVPPDAARRARRSARGGPRDICPRAAAVLAWSTVADRSGAGSSRFFNCLDTRKVGHNERRAKRGGRRGVIVQLSVHPLNGNLHARTTAGHRALKREPRLAKPSAAATHRRRRHEQLPVTPLCFTFSLLVSNHDRLPFLGPCERSERGARGGGAGCRGA